METKPSFSNILCFFLLASFLFFPHGTVSRVLLQENYDYQEDNGQTEDNGQIKTEDDGQTKAGVRKSHTHPASSWNGNDSPPSPTSQQPATFTRSVRNGGQSVVTTRSRNGNSQTVVTNGQGQSVVTTNTNGQSHTVVTNGGQRVEFSNPTRNGNSQSSEYSQYSPPPPDVFTQSSEYYSQYYPPPPDATTQSSEYYSPPDATTQSSEYYSPPDASTQSSEYTPSEACDVTNDDANCDP